MVVPKWLLPSSGSVSFFRTFTGSPHGVVSNYRQLWLPMVWCIVTSVAFSLSLFVGVSSSSREWCRDVPHVWIPCNSGCGIFGCATPLGSTTLACSFSSRWLMGCDLLRPVLLWPILLWPSPLKPILLGPDLLGPGQRKPGLVLWCGVVCCVSVCLCVCVCCACCVCVVCCVCCWGVCCVLCVLLGCVVCAVCEHLNT